MDPHIGATVLDSRDYRALNRAPNPPAIRSISRLIPPNFQCTRFHLRDLFAATSSLNSACYEFQTTVNHRGLSNENNQFFTVIL